MLTVASRSDPGTVRTVNEDSVMWESDISMIAVADGMGGHNAGEVASKLALETVRSFLKKSTTDEGFRWPFGVTPSLSVAANRLMTSIKIANRHVYRVSKKSAEYSGMGTTIVAAIAEGSRLAFCGVGDSRAYSFVGNELRQLTKDDSWVSMLVKESGLDAAAFDRHPMRHVLTNVVGTRPELDVVVEEIDLVVGQTIMLCTDGLHGALSDADIAAVLRAETNLERATETLIERAVRRDGKDNATIALARYVQMP
jgi:PPM family protein phosphatase